MFEVFVKISNAENKANDYYCYVKFVPQMFESIHVLPHFYTDINKQITPDERT